MNFIRRVVGFTLLVLTASCAGQSLAVSVQDVVNLNPESTSLKRLRLGYAELMSAKLADKAPILNRYFIAAEDAKKALHDFSGVIEIPELPMHSIPEVIKPTEIAGKQTALFPGNSIEFFTVGDYIVPVVRDVVRVHANQSFWQIQVSPGRVWSEAADLGYSRASFPFLLTSDIENESYNGLATFLYDEEKISSLRYQIVQQSTPYLIQDWFVAWNQVTAIYHPTVVKDRSELTEAFRQELADRFEVMPWSALEDKYDARWFENYEASIDPKKTITTGLIVDKVIYVKPHRTPYGDFPYPNDMRLGVWSVTKSMFGLVSMLRMAEKFGDEIFELKIKDYLNITAEHDGWDNVTFGDALNMATGIGTGSDISENNDITDGYLVDVEPYNAWYLAPTVEEKLRYVFKNHNHPWGPGEFVRYRDRSYFALSAALTGLLKEKEGPEADLSVMMQNEVYKPIGIHHLSFSTTKELPGVTAVPFFAWGLYMTVDDIAKVVTLLQEGGRYQGRQILSSEKLQEALYHTDKRGLPTGRSNQFGDKSYHMSFWHSPYKTAEGDAFSIPEMHGWGGMVIALMPNGLIGFRLGNGGYMPHEVMTDTAHKIKPFTENK